MFLALPLLAAPSDPITPLPRIKPLEPAEALKSFDVQPGFRIELVASEPLIRSPVAMEFDENGRLFVVEFPEYNQQNDPNFTEKGCVKLLDDTDGDGRFDKATVYADNLSCPVAVACWDGGIFVGVVPDLWYFKDTDGDGKADIRKKVLTGFDRDKAGESMLNSFRWESNNRFLIATGHSGGWLRRADRPDDRGVSIRRQNVRFDPRTGDFTVTSGGGQHGLTLDNWGDAFTCDNSNPLQYISYDGQYLARNPYVEAPSPIVDINAAGKHPNLHRISPPEPWREARTRLRVQRLFDGPTEGGTPFGFFTGCTGVTSYRGNAWPEEYHGNLFVGEVANNLVYRARLKPIGWLWSAARADAGREFLASRDVWFRPAQFANAPDGTLYVADMYRELIETVESMPPDLLKHVDVKGGINRGRIYRIVPEWFRQPKPPRLGSASTFDLVHLLAHPNGWHRDTAARLLYQRQDRAAIAPLRLLAYDSPSPLGRTHAWHALEGLKALTADDVLHALNDPESRLRAHALRLAEPFANDASVQAKILAMTNDSDSRVRCQLAFTLGALPADAPVDALITLLAREGDDFRVRLGVQCSSAACSGTLFARLIHDQFFRARPMGQKMLAALAGQIVAANRPADLTAMGEALDALPNSESALLHTIVRTIAEKTSSAPLPGVAAQTALKQILSDARTTAINSNAKVTSRVSALHALARASFTEVRPIIQECLSVRQPAAVQTTALELLARFDDAQVPAIVFAAWPGMSPAVRATATETLFARPAWVNQLLDEIAHGRIRASDLDPARVQLLQKSADPMLKARATQLLKGAELSQRADVIAQYKAALDRNGDPARGKAMFKDVCSVCHRLDNVGTAVGPDLATIRNSGSEKVLINILDPNREVLPKYYTYQLTTDAGVIVTGMITAETANNVTIRRADGTTAMVQRINIEQLTNTGLSAMPEGIEKQVSVDAMADLLAYLLKGT